ncbi:HDIG domain-containing metalloprotein [Ureaplasma ceti]|uniref:Ribonuclease Y n=1 Tax=Ureaplasma ceti TaxID=3119530 RepID=A0ABP9U6I1_9BACT
MFFKKWFQRKPKPSQNNSQTDLEIEIQKYQKLNEELQSKILQLNSMNSQELKRAYLDSYLNTAEKEFVNQFNLKKAELEANAQEYAQNLILNSMSRISLNSYREDLIFKVVCKNPETKSRLIGLNGRNKKAFEKTTGMELIINEDEVITISSPNLFKREIAKLLLLRLLETKNIEPNKIENYYEEETAKFLNSLSSLGEQVLKQDLNVFGLNEKIYPYIGRLKYRSSFGQNVLEHSIEVGLICEQMADALGLDKTTAKLCGFFHDIGKATDYEAGIDHVEEGLRIAKECNLSSTIMHSIEAHHDKVIVQDQYAALTKIADKLSASKPGSRNNSKDDFFKRVELYEKIVNEFPEVKTCWVLKSGFLIKIIVNPRAVKDEELGLLAHRIKTAFESHPETKSYSVTLELIKENVFKTKTAPTE